MWTWLSTPICPSAVAQNGDLMGFLFGVLLIGIGIGGAIVAYKNHLTK